MKKNQEMPRPTMAVAWKTKDNAIKIFNKLNSLGVQQTFPKVLREIEIIARQNKTDALQASELLWQLVREKKYYWVAEIEKAK